MIPLSDVEWGPIDASEDDAAFAAKYIEPPHIKEIARKHDALVTGEKGSGKTAIRKGISLTQGTTFTGEATLDFKDLEFTSIIKNLSDLSSFSGVAQLTLITNYWKYVLIIEAMKEYFLRNHLNLSIRETRAHNYLHKHGLIEHGVLGIMGLLFEKCWKLISDMISGEKKPEVHDIALPSNLSPQVAEKVAHFPMFESEFAAVSKDFAAVLRDRKECLYISVDGLDRLRTSTPTEISTIQIVFDGLAQATYELSISKDFADSLFLKAFLPYDRFLCLQLRDKDKIDDRTGIIRWDYSSLKEFLSRRMAQHPRLGAKHTFDQQWHEIMPETLENTFYRVPENTYDYILRHTMYRPRHLQWHLKELAKKYPGAPMDVSMIPKALRESCKGLVDHYLSEYAIDHPQLEAFLRRMKGYCNVMVYAKFRQRVEDACKYLNVSIDIDKKIDTLYRIGVFGYVQELTEDHHKIQRVFRYCPPRKKGVNAYRCNFYYTKPHRRVTTVLEDGTLIGIHPMFFDFIDLSPHPDLIVG